MKRVILFAVFMISALSAKAFDWSSLLLPQPQYQNYQNYPPYQTYETYPMTLTPAQPAVPAVPWQPTDSSTAQAYPPVYCQYSQNQYNPYLYQRPYYPYNNGLGSTIINPITSGLGSTNGSQQVMKNVGRNMLYSMLRRY